MGHHEVLNDAAIMWTGVKTGCTGTKAAAGTKAPDKWKRGEINTCTVQTQAEGKPYHVSRALPTRQ